MKLRRDLSGAKVARRLARHYGYRVTRSRGSHMAVTLTAGGEQHQVTVPRHRFKRWMTAPVFELACEQAGAP